MEKRCISISECEPGDLIAQKVVSKYGATIVVENTTVNNYIKNKLIAFEIEYVWIYGMLEEDSIKHNDLNLTQLKTIYKNNVIEIKEILNDLAKGKNISIDKIECISGSIFNSINDEYYAVRCLNELKSMDEDTFTHSVNVAIYAMLLAKWMLLPERKIIDVVNAGLLHDVGKIKLPDSILSKKEKLETDDYEEIKKHPIYGFDIIKSIEGLSNESKEAVLMHHERENGSGYPIGKRGADIGVCAKIVAIANLYDSITSERFYRKSLTPFEAFEVIQSQIINKLDMHIADTFMSNLAACYVGAKVLLNNDKIGEVVYVPPQAITQPIICVDSDYLDLARETNLKVVSML